MFVAEKSKQVIQDSCLCLQGSDLLYEVEVPGPATVLALNNGNGGNKIFSVHIIKCWFSALMKIHCLCLLMAFCLDF